MPQPPFNIYCTNNKDGTGACWETKTGESIKCIVIPGETISCDGPDSYGLNCIIVDNLIFNCSKLDTDGLTTNLKPNLLDSSDKHRDQDPSSSRKEIVNPSRVLNPPLSGDVLRDNTTNFKNEFKPEF